MRLTEEEVSGLSAQQLSELTTLAASLHKLDAPEEESPSHLN